MIPLSKKPISDNLGQPEQDHKLEEAVGEETEVNWRAGGLASVTLRLFSGPWFPNWWNKGFKTVSMSLSLLKKIDNVISSIPGPTYK